MNRLERRGGGGGGRERGGQGRKSACRGNDRQGKKRNGIKR